MQIKYNSAGELLDSIPREKRRFDIENAVFKAWPLIHGYEREDGSHFVVYDRIMVSISGGSDSDIMLDLIERIGHPFNEVHYAFYNTGLEFSATKRHLKYLEKRYGITIEQYRAKTPVPLGIKRYGLPFLSKRVSQYINRLQKHGFTWQDRPFSELYDEWPRCKAALRWWCNEWGEKSQLNISQNRWLKEFIVQNPPAFQISDGCCDGAKKLTAHMVEGLIKPHLSCQGVRKSEGGARATAYKSCFDNVIGGCDVLRPIFWFTNDDKRAYEEIFGITHSDCYTTYGLTRTGCACCPFGRNFETELAAAARYEPALYKAAVNLFGPSYEYTRRYKEYNAGGGNRDDRK